MKSFKIVFLVVVLLSFTGCKIGRFVVYNFADIDDYKIFPSRIVATDSVAYRFPKALKGRSPKTITISDKEYPFDRFLEENQTVAFLIIQNDTIQYEKYWHKYDESAMVASFSMAKSVLSILIGCAIDDGLIQSVQEPVTHYIPELKENGFENVTIEHLLQMTSGLKFNEGYYNPFGEVATYYYGTNLRKEIRKMRLKRVPGETFEYVSGNSQLLGLILERALENRTISDYLEEKLWKPLGMEYDATWSLDREKDGLEKTFCCLNARARDFAKIGRLYEKNGSWNGNQIVSKQWVERSTQRDTLNGSAAKYQYNWWLPSDKGDFMAKGILGQYIYVYPEKNLVIVRLGKEKGEVDWDTVLSVMGSQYQYP